MSDGGSIPVAKGGGWRWTTCASVNIAITIHIMSEQQSEYGARAAPADFNEFMAAIGGDGVTIDADLYEEFFGHAPG